MRAHTCVLGCCMRVRATQFVCLCVVVHECRGVVGEHRDLIGTVCTLPLLYALSGYSQAHIERFNEPTIQERWDDPGSLALRIWHDIQGRVQDVLRLHNIIQPCNHSP